MKQVGPDPSWQPGVSVSVDRWWLGWEHKWWIFLTVGVGTFMGALSSSIVNAVLPVIQRGLGADLSTVEWVIMSNLLTLSILLLGFGRLSDILGHNRIFGVGFVVFVLGSVLSNVSPIAGLLIAFRVFQALGASMVAATISAFINYVCVYSVVFLSPFYLVQGRGFTPSHAGLLLTSQPLVI